MYSRAYECFQNDQLRLLDVIQTVNDQPFIPGARISGQEHFDKMTSSSTTVVLDVSHLIALPPVSKQLKEGM